MVVGSGDKQQNFDVHEAILITRSSFFKAALSGDWTEAKARVVKLPEDDPDVFQNYIHLLYTGLLRIGSTIIPRNYIGYDERVAMMKLYVLAEKLQDMETKNATVNATIGYLSEMRNTASMKRPDTTCFHIIYEVTPVKSPMRRLMVDYYAYNAGQTWIGSQKGAWPNEFMHDLAVNLIEKRQLPSNKAAIFDDILFYVKTEYHTQHEVDIPGGARLANI